MLGCTAPDNGYEQDLVMLVVVDQGEKIFVSSSTSNASDPRKCGEMSKPCIFLNTTLPHIIPSVYSNLLVDEISLISGEASTHDMTVKSLDAEGVRGDIMLNSNTIFAQEASSGGSEIKLNCSIIEMSGGRLTMSDCTFASVHLSSSCVEARGGQYCSFADLNISEVNSAVLLEFSDLALLSMLLLHTSTCRVL
ncbi:uncharacterized protein MONOS_2645 [Monocercomonoides exilis]|uniref:uncharacterized protein n=1 Tax=Monocercomonoides exilis TaxID=2049356 RepID=UPI0035593EAC|nr:hypothetical protein MONOS_2645 [Monocercomonoides exilis]|eukprot:MONOS_2645.1-p1 / transcript=MONOS_2645.1 / gene=MONOS_2645 / organism=Monocercomonoides_exilis_PA203 / gene_product=unspecified product / transcript_product=unspecified product / location=Mono_scaffold00055:161682-162402(-) / protein_length=194 / sequence_SO=supercontig / SO=protein_coding / is_pseudo=false